MTHKDGRGLEVSTGNPDSLAAYEQALHLLHGYYGDPVTIVDTAVRQDPAFLMGHAMLAGMYVVGSEKRALGPLRDQVVAAEGLIAQGIGTDRERAHVAAARAWLDGGFERATDLYNRIVIEHPRDVLAVQLSHICNFLLGRSRSLRDGATWALPHLDKKDFSTSYVQGMLAFGLEENGAYDEALRAAGRALQINPRDPWAIHAAAHVFEMQGRAPEGIRHYEERLAEWSENNFFSIHNWWHLGLFNLDLGNQERVMEIYDQHIRGTKSLVNLDLVDASAYLWRLELGGLPVGDRWKELADAWNGVEEEGFFAFNDVHALMAYAGAGRSQEVARVKDGLAAVATGRNTNAMMAREVGLPVAEALAAFAAGDYKTAVDGLLFSRLSAHRFGGSHAQRDLLDWTLVEAALRGRLQGVARAIISERLARKPDSPQGPAFLARLFDGAGDAPAAKLVRERAAAARVPERAGAQRASSAS